MFESLENLQVSEACFSDIADRVQRIIENTPPVVYHEFDNGKVYAQGQVFPTEQTNTVVKAKDVGAEYVQTKRKRRAPSRKKKISIKDVPGQQKLF
jgi:hypothetical protein